jgi:hypothetical protein
MEAIVMGSFATSLHVKCDDTELVIAAIKNVIRDAGYETTEEPLDENAEWGMPSALRGIHVSRAHNGWVGLLDSDLVNSFALVADLSRSLETYAIVFLVHDSDSWNYQLCRCGSQLDEFSSSAEINQEHDLPEVSPEAVQRMLDLRQQMLDGMPSEIREIEARFMEGTATQEEMKRFSEWAEANSEQVTRHISQIASEMSPPVASHSPAEREFGDHIEKLRPILRPDATDGRVSEVLCKQTLFAEQVLREFLELLGVQQGFADLSHRYLEEWTETELLKNGIEIVAHLKFKSSSPDFD